LSRGGKFSQKLEAMLAPDSAPLGLGHYKTWFLLILEDLALVVSPELAENTWTPATGPWPLTKAELERDSTITGDPKFS
jgi:hypothetical protein